MSYLNEWWNAGKTPSTIPEQQTTISHFPGNASATALKIIGKLIIILGILAGIIVVLANDFVSGIIAIASSIISGTLFVGFGEVINLLHQMNVRQIQASPLSLKSVEKLPPIKIEE